MPLLSILTSEYAPTAAFVDDTIASVAKQQLPDGWEYEWIVQEDGSTPSLREKYEGIPYVRYEANGGQFGLAATRNLALGRASGELVQNLDHDDILLPGALAALVPYFDQPVHWAVGQADDLLPDGSRVPFESALPYGPLAAGRANDWALQNGGNWPIHCAGLMMRTSTLRAIGGWPGLPIDDDVTMFAGLSELADGYNHPAVTWLYRHHAGQLSRETDSRNRHSMLGRRMAVQRVQALRASNQLRSLDTVVSSADEFGTAVEVGPLSKEKSRYRIT